MSQDAVKDVAKAFASLRFQNEAVKKLSDFALIRLAVAVEDKKSKAEEEWFDRCMKIAVAAPSRTKDEKMSRVRALTSKRREYVD